MQRAVVFFFLLGATLMSASPSPATVGADTQAATPSLTGAGQQDHDRSQGTSENPSSLSDTHGWTSKQEDEWQSALEQMRGIGQSTASDELKCQRKWDILWTLAKDGNLEARYKLYNVIGKWNDFYYMGRPVALISKDNIRTILYFSSLGSPSMDAEIKDMRAALSSDPSSLRNYLPALSSRPDIQSCIMTKASQECTDLVVRKGLIPSFEQIAMEIDLLLKGGAQVVCLGDKSTSIAPEQ